MGHHLNFGFREEDKTVLLTCKEHGAGEDAWQRLCDALPHRSKLQIQSRYETLRKMLNSWLKSKSPPVQDSEDGESSASEYSDSDSDS